MKSLKIKEIARVIMGIIGFYASSISQLYVCPLFAYDGGDFV